jgi:hypothetical protein
LHYHDIVLGDRVCVHAVDVSHICQQVLPRHPTVAVGGETCFGCSIQYSHMVYGVNGVVWGAVCCVLTGPVQPMGRDGNWFIFMFI